MSMLRDKFYAQKDRQKPPGKSPPRSESQKWPTDKAKYDSEYDRIFRGKKSGS